MARARDHYRPVSRQDDGAPNNGTDRAPAPRSGQGSVGGMLVLLGSLTLMFFGFVFASTLAPPTPTAPDARRRPAPKGRKGSKMNKNLERTSGGDTRWVPFTDVFNGSPVQPLSRFDDVGGYPLQGLALSSRVLFVSYTLALRSLLFSSTTLVPDMILKTKVFEPSVLLEQLQVPITHFGGIDFSDSSSNGKELWIASHGSSNDTGALFAVDCATLAPKPRRLIKTDFNLDWVAQRDGTLYYGAFFEIRKIFRADLLTLKPYEPLVLSLDFFSPPNYIQSASFDAQGNLLLLSDDYQTTLYNISLAEPLATLQSTQALLLGSETDGLTFHKPTASMLVGLNRQHSHEQTMGDSPFASVVRLVSTTIKT